MKLQLKRSNVLVSGGAKEPTASQLDYGELAINYSAGDAAIFLKDSTNNVIRIAGVHNIADDGLTNVPTTTSPPTTPTPEAGNLWYNSEDGRLYIYYVDDNSSQWVDASPDTWQTTVIPDTTDPAHQAGTLDDRYVNINGDTLTGALLLDNAATSTAPDLAFDGDLNTGIYSPGADKFAIATAGVQRVTVDGSGNVGIGTSGPSKALEIYRDSFPCLLLNDGGQYKSYMQLGGNDLEIRGSSGTIEFYTGAADGLSSTERMRITSSGNVGIGNTAPAEKLHVGGNIRFGANTTYYGQIEHDEGSTGSNIYTNNDSGGHIFKRNASEQMRIDSSGRLLLGTTTPGDGSADDLTISSAGHTGISIKSGSSDSGGIYFGDGTSGASQYEGIIQYSHAINALQFYTNYGVNSGANSMTIDSSGRLLLGTTTEGAANEADNVTISGTGDVGITLRSTNSAINRIYFSDGTSGTSEYAGYQLYNHSSNAMIFGTNAIERMRIDSSGRVLIGSSAVQTHPNMDDLQLGDGTGNRGLTISSGTSSYGTLAFGDSTDASGNDRYSGSIEYYHADNSMRFYTDIGERMRITSSGNVGIGTSSPSAKLDVYLGDNVAGTIARFGGYNNGRSLVISNSGIGNLIDINHQGGSGEISVSTGSTERLRVNSSGNVGIGTSSPVAKLDVRGNIYAGSNIFVDTTSQVSSGKISVVFNGTNFNGMCLKTTRDENNSAFLVFIDSDGSSIGSVQQNAASTVLYATSSDYRLKENVAAIDDGINRVKQLKPCRFNFIKDTIQTVDGFLAHEAQAVVPEAVTGEKDGEMMQGIDQSKLVPLLTAALQEAIAKIETLEQRLSDAGIA